MELVSFETAKLAKEKGFNEPCWEWYGIEKLHNNKIFHESSSLSHTINCPCNRILQKEYNNSWEEYISAPYKYQLMDWLREEYNIFISIKPEVYKDGINWTYQISFIDTVENYNAKSTCSYGNNGELIIDYKRKLKEINAQDFYTIRCIYENYRRNNYGM